VPQLGDAARALERGDRLREPPARDPVGRRERRAVLGVGRLLDHERAARGTARDDADERARLAPELPRHRRRVVVSEHARILPGAPAARRSGAARGEPGGVPPPSRLVARARRRRAKRFAALLAGLLVVGLYVGPVRSLIAARNATDGIRADVTRLRHEQAQLRVRLDRLQTNAAIVALARDNGFVFPGETPYVVQPAR
jgi:hypothetical protein